MTIRLKGNHSVLNTHYLDLVASFLKYPQSLPHFQIHNKNNYDIHPDSNQNCTSHWLNENEYQFIQECMI